MAATGHQFPDITPSSRVYTPGTYPTKEFQGLNGAVTTLQYGHKSVDSKLQMTFQNITDDQAWEIMENYDKASNGRDRDTGEHDYVVLLSSAQTGVTKGVLNIDLRRQMTERQESARLRYRYAKPPQITSTFPGRSTVTVELRGYLEGADSVNI